MTDPSERIQQLEDALNEYEAHFRTVLLRHHSGKVDDGCEYNWKETRPLAVLAAPKGPTVNWHPEGTNE